MADSILSSFLPLLIVTLGAFVSELAGVLNIAVEGIMILGSFVAAATAGSALGPVPAVLCAGLAGLFLGLFLGFLHGRLSANIFVAGLGMNVLASSLVTVLGQGLFHTQGIIRLPTGSSGMDLPLEIILGLGAFAFIFFSYSWSLMGIRFRSLANHADMLYARGVNVRGYKIWALGISGAFAAIGGAFLTWNVGAFVPNGTNGKGWIALVLVYAGARHPLGIALACIAFVASERLAISLQSSLVHPALIVGLPYLIVLLCLVGVQALARKRLDL